MDSENLRENIQVVRGRPILKDPLGFFQYKQGSRNFLTITDSADVWKDDLIISERFFATTVVCPYRASDMETHTSEMTCVKDILSQRMKYPGVKENPALEQIAKTWVVPGKLHLGPSMEDSLGLDNTALTVKFDSIFELLKTDTKLFQFLKVELSNGMERMMIYRLLDAGFRPSLLLVKWSEDLDTHLGTAYCAGHVMNCGYSLVAVEGSYALYVFSDQVLYDICSMKSPSSKNPMLQSILESVSETMKSVSAEPVPEAVPEAVPTNNSST